MTTTAHASDDLLIDLSAGLLDEEGRAGALRHLRGCPACERRFLEATRQAERLSTSPLPAGLRPAAAARWTRRASLLAAAAAVVIVAGASIALRGPRADGLDVRLPLDAEMSLTRSALAPGAATETDAARADEAVAAYHRGDHARVVSLLGDPPLPKRYEPLNLLFASALLAEGRPADAVSVLERLDTLTLPQPWRDRGRWLLYVALRRDGRSDAAESIRKELAASPGEIGDRARAAAARPAPAGP